MYPKQAMTMFLLSVVASARREDDAYRIKDASSSSRIIGGQRTEEDRFPYVVSLNDFSHFCAGSLIANDFVLTAAHCLGGSYSVRIGTDRSSNRGVNVEMLREYEHPDYNDRNDDNDIALVKLSEPAGRGMPLVRMNPNEDVPFVGMWAHVMGWGDQNPDEDITRLAKNLMGVDIQVISNSQCERSSRGEDSYRGWIYDSMLCTMTQGQDACQGDSGGPLIIKGDSPEEDVQIGVVSWGIGCAYLPGVFSRTSSAYDWIRTVVCEDSAEPPMSLCDTERMPSTAPSSSSSPSGMPSLSTEPSMAPTGGPSSEPSGSPSVAPSVYPTLTIKPSATPSEVPSLAPSSWPTRSSLPSASPRPSVSQAPVSYRSELVEARKSEGNTPVNASDRLASFRSMLSLPIVLASLLVLEQII
mmetsp:Transcript_12587/g.28835  ORF Transcript_12587/g.28835 Transcript_12587/m.28835 type:complete len:413 (+) Transcript_12587:225-1463(+)